MKQKGPDLSGIENLILDLGGVVVNIDVSRTALLFGKLGMKGLSAGHITSAAYPFFEQYETGKIPTGQFREGIRKAAGVPIPDFEIDSAWNSMITGIPRRMIELLQALRSRFRTFVLSNTNRLHIEYLNRILLETEGISGLNELFDGVFLSHEVHLRKPDPAVFEHVLKTAVILPEETLYIDDSKEHTESAAGLGIKTIHLGAGRTLFELFSQE